jgi:hypothetical protein
MGSTGKVLFPVGLYLPGEMQAEKINVRLRSTGKNNLWLKSHKLQVLYRQLLERLYTINPKLN